MNIYESTVAEPLCLYSDLWAYPSELTEVLFNAKGISIEKLAELKLAPKKASQSPIEKEDIIIELFDMTDNYLPLKEIEEAMSLKNQSSVIQFRSYKKQPVLAILIEEKKNSEKKLIITIYQLYSKRVDWSELTRPETSIWSCTSSDNSYLENAYSKLDATSSTSRRHFPEGPTAGIAQWFADLLYDKDPIFQLSGEIKDKIVEIEKVVQKRHADDRKISSGAPSAPPAPATVEPTPTTVSPEAVKIPKAEKSKEGRVAIIAERQAVTPPPSLQIPKPPLSPPSASVNTTPTTISRIDPPLSRFQRISGWLARTWVNFRSAISSCFNACFGWMFRQS